MEFIQKSNRKWLTVGARSVYYDSKAKQYIKEYYAFDKDWYEEHPRLMNKYYPNYFVSKSCTDNSMTMVCNEVAGDNLGIIKNIQELDRIYEFCISECKRTYPYAHLDWNFNNIICKPNGNYHFVDFDEFQESTWPRTLMQLHFQFRTKICRRNGNPPKGAIKFWKSYWKWKKGKQWKEYMNVEIYESNMELFCRSK